MIKIIKDNEYIITNGLGGFSSSSVTGANTRKYHSILNASLNAPVSRHVLLSKIITEITIDDKTYILESTEYDNEFLDHTAYTSQFTDFPLPIFTYDIEGVKIIKTIAMVYGENTVSVAYDIHTTKELTLKTYLHVNQRDHHDLSTENTFNYTIEEDNTTIKLKSNLVDFYINGFGNYTSINEWARPEYYAVEDRRGQEDTDTNLIIGSFQTIITKDTTLGIVASTELKTDTCGDIIANETKRRLSLTQDKSTISKRLHIGCDAFIVNRTSTQSKTVIAGYPWFTDWGRDTMIALPGLTLSTNRYDDAKDIIKTFIKYEKNGLIPNMFPDDNIEPLYNTIDGTLWLFIAIFKYYNETEDETLIKEIWPTLEGIINKHIDGTTYNIHLDKDGLLSGGDPSTQLTWMDVKIDGHVVTPRHGKAVEINALWFNALNIMDYLASKLERKSSIDYAKYADLCFTNFNQKFWNEEALCLYDLIQDDQPVDRIRPNQIFAVSLPFGILDEAKEKAVVKIVEEKLLTPFGLRSLSQDHFDYKPIYDGDVYNRDYAYHQGTVWGWLMGPYLEAHYNVYEDKQYLNKHIKTLLEHLDDTGIGHISEVFSGDEPHHPRGCFGQAWSISELLRLYKLAND